MHPLDPAVARVNRAQEHLVDLIRRTALPGQAFDPRPWAKQIVENLMFSILVGEVCYNLRAALDYLVFELAKLASGAEQKRTQFPIEDDPAEFPEGRLKGLTRAHRTAIEALQPYNGCEWTRRLRDWSNPDKHRTLAPVQIEQEFTVHVVDEHRLRDFEDMPGAIHATVNRDGTQVHVKLRLGTTLQFADDGSPVIQPLEEISTHVAGTLQQFRPDFRVT
jgi:hypothetical protein